MKTPTINERGPVGLVLWLRQDQPAVWQQLVTAIPEVANIEATIRREESLQGLGLFAQIGKAIAGFAVKALPKITAALPQIATAAVEIGGQVLVAKQQKKLIDSQIKQAEANQAPLPTAMVPNQSVAVPDFTGAGYTLQPRVVAATLIPGVPDAVTYVGGGLVLLVALKKAGIL